MPRGVGQQQGCSSRAVIVVAGCSTQDEVGTDTNRFYGSLPSTSDPQSTGHGTNTVIRNEAEPSGSIDSKLDLILGQIQELHQRMTYLQEQNDQAMALFDTASR